MTKRPESTVTPPLPRVEKGNLSTLLILIVILITVAVVLIKLP